MRINETAEMQMSRNRLMNFLYMAWLVVGYGDKQSVPVIPVQK